MEQQIQNIYIFCNSVSTILHVLGLILLWRARKSMDAIQTLLLANLSLSELLGCVTFLTFIFLTQTLKIRLDMRILMFTHQFTYTAMHLIMLLLTLERLLRFSLNLRYPLYVTKRKIQIAAGGMWLISLVYSSILVYGSLTFPARLAISVHIALEWTFVALAICTYGFAISLIINSRRGTKENALRSKEVLKGFKVGALVIFTFLLFVVTPITWNAVYYFKEPRQRMPFNEAMFCVILETSAFIADPLTYIFLLKKVRNQLICRKRNVHPFEQTEMSEA